MKTHITKKIPKVPKNKRVQLSEGYSKVNIINIIIMLLGIALFIYIIINQ